MNLRRRDFLIGTVGVVAWRQATRAQQLDRMKRVGMLLLFAASDPQARARVVAFGQGLQDLGWREGLNVQIQYRFAAGDIDRMHVLAKELVDLQADVIVVNVPPVIAMIRQYTPALPIVFAAMADPVEAGFMYSLSRPDANITGFTSVEYSIVGKWLQLLKQIAPRLMRVGMAFNPNAAYAGALYWLRQFETTARSLALEPITAPVRNLADVQDALAALGRAPDSGLIVETDTFTSGHYAQIVALAAQYRVPGCYPFSYWATAGGLMSYGPNGPDLYRRAASYVDRILRGASPADLPVQQPSKFELVINLKAAEALGLTVPPIMLARADEVIE